MEDIVVDMVVLDSAEYTVALLCGEIDCFTGPGLHARLLDLAAATRRPLVIDMSGVTFCDGSALRMLSTTGRRCAEDGLAIVGLRPFLANLFRAFGLHERLPLCGTLDEALWCLLPLADDMIEDFLDQA